MLTTIEHCTGQSPTTSIIWLHGLGADGNDFLPIAHELALPINVRFIFPNAPSMPVSINGGHVMPAWYDISSPDITNAQDETGIRRSQGMIEELIALEIKRGIPAKSIVMEGFSQGGAVVLHTGMRCEQTLGGIIALSTYLPLQSPLNNERSSTNANIPIFMAHGTQDSIVPIETGRASARLLEARGYSVDWREYAMPHTVCNEEIDAIRKFLLKVLQGPAQ